MRKDLFKVEQDGHIAWLTLNRPDHRNIMGLAFFKELKEHFQRFDKDSSVRGIVIKAEGKSFTAGNVGNEKKEKMLIENTFFGVVNKIEDAIAFLKEHEPSKGYYVAFSGGKDSIVMLDLVRKSGVKHDIHMNLTSVDPPELLRFVRKHYPNIDFVKPRKSMYTLIVEKGFPPTRMIRYCCEYLKEHSGTGRHVLVGVRSEESSQRAAYGFIQTDTKDKSKTILRPILRWTEGDIWDYIEEQKLPYCPLYDEGFSRIGCIMCTKTGPKQMQREAKRWPAIYKMYLGAMEKAILKSKERGKKCSQTTGQEMMDWWINYK